MLKDCVCVSAQTEKLGQKEWKISKRTGEGE